MQAKQCEIGKMYRYPNEDGGTCTGKCVYKGKGETLFEEEYGLFTSDDDATDFELYHPIPGQVMPAGDLPLPCWAKGPFGLRLITQSDHPNHVRAVDEMGREHGIDDNCDYTFLAPASPDSIQAQAAEIARLQKRVAELEEQVAYLCIDIGSYHKMEQQAQEFMKFLSGLGCDCKQGRGHEINFGLITNFIHTLHAQAHPAACTVGELKDGEWVWVKMQRRYHGADGNTINLTERIDAPHWILNSTPCRRTEAK